MKKITVPRGIVQPPLAAGQLWRMAGAELRVGMVGNCGGALQMWQAATRVRATMPAGAQ